MRLISNMPSTRRSGNATTCGFFTRIGGVLRGYGICRILPRNAIRKCGGNPRSADQAPVLAFCDLRFCSQKGIVLCGFRFFPALPENEALYRVFQRQWRHPRQHPGAAETSKGHCRNTEQRPFFVIASRRVRDDCITERILP